MAGPFLALRRFFNGPLLARLDDQAAAVTALTRRLDERLDTLASRADHIQERVDGLPPRFDVLQDRVDETSDRLAAATIQAEGLSTALGDLASRHDGFATRQADHATAQRYTARQAAEQGRRMAAALERTEARLADFSARLDEIEIKSRPLIAFDEESWAVRLREGYALVPRADPVFATAVANASSGGLEPGVRRVLHALIEPGMGVADVGANVGLLTLACAFATGPGGRVWSFEPEPGPHAQLAKTLHLNGLAWVTLSDAAVGATPGRASFNVSPIIGHSSLHALPEDERGAARSLDVEVTTLDKAIPPGARLDVVKIDVEGAELDVLAGMTRLLAENADIAVVAEYGPSHLDRIGVTPANWFAAFEAQGFEAWLIEEPFGTCRPLTDAVSALDGVHSANLAFVRPGGAAAARLPRA